MASPIREGKPTGTVAWSNGSTFNGFALCGLKSMTGYSDTQFTLANSALNNALPKSNFTKLQIIEGQYSQACGLIYNADINPPGTYYVAWVYDNSGEQIAGPSDPFQVSTGTFTMPSFTLTVPSVGSNPTPNS